MANLMLWLQRQQGARLWRVLVVFDVFGAGLMVAIMHWLLGATTSSNYLLISFVAALGVGLLGQALLVFLLSSHARAHATDRERAELALAASNNLLQSIIDTVPLRVFWKDRESRYLGCNLGFAQDSGVSSPADLIGQDDFALAWKDQATTHRANDLAVMAGQQKLASIEQHTKAGGALIWLRLSKVPLRDANGRVVGVLGVYEDVTAFKEAEQAALASGERAARLATLLRLVSDNVTDMIWAKDLEKRYLFANKSMCEQLLGASSTDEPIGRDDLFFARRMQDSQPDNPAWYTFGQSSAASDAETLRNGRPTRFDENAYVRGELVFLDVHKAPLLDDQGQVIGVVGSARDVTAQRAAQEKLRLASLVLENSSEAMVATDGNNRIVDINPAFSTLTGYSRDEVIGQDPGLLRSGRHNGEFYKNLWRELDDKGHWQGELWNKRKNGEIYAEWLTINTSYHEDGSVNRRVALFSDITEKKLSEEMVWRQANFDALTNLPNRRLFLDRLAQDLLKSHRTGRQLALLFLDLDHFKDVNDSLGHEAGDQLLREASRRIMGCVRATDTVARLAGDEFTVILPDLEDLSRVEIIAGAIIAELAQVFEIDHHEVAVSASVGITIYPDDASDQTILMQNADQAMYEAKRAGRNRFSFFTRAMQLKAQDNLELMNDLRRGMDNGELKLYFQPVVALKTGELHKVEALLRWFHPQRGMVGPAEFIPLAEEYGLIHQVGAWVFSQAVLQAQHWSEHLGRDFKIALNVSPMQLMQANIHRIRWQEQLAVGGISGQQFVIEISEDMLHDASDAVTNQLKEFRDAGTQVAVDHFGAGYSSFVELKKRQIEFFKIEKATIACLSANSEEYALAQAVVVIAHQLGLKVIAEGVETLQQHQLLLGMGCDFAQGYLYSKPVAASEVEALFSQDRQLNLPI